MKYTVFTVVLCGSLIAASGLASQHPSKHPPQIDVAMQSERTASAAGSVLDRSISVNFEQVSMASALQDIARRSSTRIQYRAELVDRIASRVTLRAENITVGKALEVILANTGLHAVPYAENIVTIKVKSAESVATDGVITGVVRNAKTNQPVANASVTLGDGTVTTQTDGQGRFRIPAAIGEHRLTVRAIGFSRVVRVVTVPERGAAEVEVSVEATANVLNEVVVTGTVVATERKAIPNPITVITAEEIEKRGITRVEQFLRGEVPGVIALDRGTMGYSAFSLGIMQTSEVYARGASTTTGRPTPVKTYIDGVEILDPSYLGTIDPQSIERIEIIAGPQAATVYGSGAMGGVMQIFTKKGHANQAPDIAFTIKYGILENNLTSGLTPSHQHTLAVNDGGPEFSYALNLSHNYRGQWQPDLFSRNFGASVGVTRTRGPLTAKGSVSATLGRNGGFTNTTPFYAERINNGEWTYRSTAGAAMRSVSSSQTIAFSADYQMLPYWRHTVTVGRSGTKFDIDPLAPRMTGAWDTLYDTRSSNGSRVTFGYNTTLQTKIQDKLSSSLTMGMTGSQGEQAQISGYVASKSAPYFEPNVSVSRSLDTKSLGGFGTWQLGLWDHLFLTLGLRGESNPNYGRSHKIDWTPTNGLAYAMDFGDVTVKLMGSYGRATRPPEPYQRLEERRVDTRFLPSHWVSNFANSQLRPERSRGPQGGIELYYGSRATLTVNHYNQVVSDLIQQVRIDSFPAIQISDNTERMMAQVQYRNTATVRQRGWEGTGSVSFLALTLKGTYFWNDSRVVSVNPTASLGYKPGQMFTGVPTHAGSFTVTYAHAQTNVSLTTNFMGRLTTTGYGGPHSEILYYEPTNNRLPMYVSHRISNSSLNLSQRGYAKSDLSLMHRMSRRASLLVNVTNLGNSYGHEGMIIYPTLGRQTLFGFSLR